MIELTRMKKTFESAMICFVLVFHVTLSSAQVSEQPLIFDHQKPTLFPKIHSNLNGMVGEFVRTLYQDKAGNYWFGTNDNGLIRYNGRVLEKVVIPGDHDWMAVREIVEDQSGNVWFGTSDGLVKYDGNKFVLLSEKDGLINNEIWGLCFDKGGKLWIGTVGGVCVFDGKDFLKFDLPEKEVEDREYMLGPKCVNKIMEQKDGSIWFVNDGNGIFTYKNGIFNHLTSANGLIDNNVADVYEDSRSNIWIGTFLGGISKYNSLSTVHLTREGTVKGQEVYNILEDREGNIWFSVEGIGVYRHDGKTFQLFTTEEGLTNNGVQSIRADNKGQIWFSTWQGICIYDGQRIQNANIREPWTN